MDTERMMKKEVEIWSRSIREEIIAGLYLIAALQAWGLGWKVFAGLLFLKSAVDALIAMRFAVLEAKSMKS